MGESANLAFYAIVYSKGLVPKQRLQDALNKATLDGVPLETVLLESGAIKASDCVDALALRAKLGRSCASCKGTTYLLPDKSESEEPCEFCGGKLLPPERSGEKQVRKPAPSARHSRAAVASSGERRRSRASQRVAARREGGAPAGLRALEERLKALEGRSVTEERILEIVEQRLAQEDLASFLEHVTQEATQRALQAVEGGGATNDAAGGVDLDVGALAEDVAERAAVRALAIVQERVEHADLSGLFERVTEVATERTLANLQGAAPTGSASALDEDRLAETAARRALEAVEARLATPPPRGEDDELSNEVQALEDYLQQHDLDALAQRLDRLEGLQAAVAELQEQAQPLLDLVPRIDALEERAKEAVDPGEVAALREAVGALDPAAIEERLQRGLQERFDQELAALPEKIGQEASAPVLEAIEARIRALDLAGLPARVAEEATGSVLARVREDAREAVREALAEHSNGSGDAAALEELRAEIGRSEGRLLEAVELRLSQSPPPEELARTATAQALAAVDERVAQLQASGGGDAEGLAALQDQIMALTTRLEEVAAVAAGAGPGVDEAAVEAIARRVAEEVSAAGGSAAAGGLDEAAVEAIARRVAGEVAQASANAGGAGGGEVGAATQIINRSALAGAANYDHKKFVALAREVKNLKDKTKQLASGGGGGGGGGGDFADKTEFRQLAVQVKSLEDRIAALKPGGGGGGGAGAGKALDVVGLINSTEFKQTFDTKINQVLSYIKSDVVPKAVKKTLESQ